MVILGIAAQACQWALRHIFLKIYGNLMYLKCGFTLPNEVIQSRSWPHWNLMGSGPHGKKRPAPCVQQADCQLDTVVRKSNRWLCPAQNGVDLQTALMVHMMVKPLDEWGTRFLAWSTQLVWVVPTSVSEENRMKFGELDTVLLCGFLPGGRFPPELLLLRGGKTNRWLGSAREMFQNNRGTMWNAVPKKATGYL